MPGIGHHESSVPTPRRRSTDGAPGERFLNGGECRHAGDQRDSRHDAFFLDEDSEGQVVGTPGSGRPRCAQTSSRLRRGLCRVLSMPPPMDPVAERLGPHARLVDQRVPFLSDLVVRWPLTTPDAVQLI
jgi:hypothetical protein